MSTSLKFESDGYLTDHSKKRFRAEDHVILNSTFTALLLKVTEEMEELKVMMGRLMIEVKEMRQENKILQEIVGRLVEENKEIRKENKIFE